MVHETIIAVCVCACVITYLLLLDVSVTVSVTHGKRWFGLLGQLVYDDGDDDDIHKAIAPQIAPVPSPQMHSQN